MSTVAKPRPTFTASQMEDRLAARYKGDQSEILFGVRDNAGFSAKRTADAIAVGLWPSTGCTLEGFEIKVSRSDWTRELKDGAKSEAFVPFMDFWWLVAPRDVVNDDELPPTWGLLIPHGDGLKVAKQAKRNETVQPMPRGMLVALIKRASTAQARAAALDAKYREGIKVGEGRRSATYDEKRYADLREKVDRFTKETGISPEYVYDREALRKAHAMVQNGGHLDLARRLGYSAENVKKLAHDLRKVATEIEGSPPKPLPNAPQGPTGSDADSDPVAL